MKRYSIFGYYGQGNAGDEAILSALIDGIKSHDNNAAISVYSANPTETKENHRVNAYKFFNLNLKAIVIGTLGRSRRSYISSVLNFFKTDTVIIGGGGLFFDSKETNQWIYGYINLIHQAKSYGKKVALVGISVGPLHHKESEIAIAEAFSRVDLISVRDESSRELLIKCGIAADKIHVIPDLVFTLASAPASRIDDVLSSEKISTNQHKNIALTPCCYNISQQGWVEQYAAFIEKMVNELHANIWLVPMQRAKDHDDLHAIKTIYKTLSPTTQAKAFPIEGIYSAKEVQGLLSRADFVFAERLHGSIMAINTGTQFMSIEYMPKVTGVLIQAKLKHRGISMLDFLSGTALENNFSDIAKYLNQSEENQFNTQSIKKQATDNFLRLCAL